MSSKEEHLSRFLIDPPENLPESLRDRLIFHSCLSNKADRSVWLVQDSESDSHAILKITVPGSPDSVRREYELLKKLNHPSIPRVILYESDAEGREYLLKDYAEGETLDKILDRDGVFGNRQTLEITQKLCEILSYLHSQNPPVIYRDVKPQNIVITAGGRLSLLDFGISREGKKDRAYDTVYVGSVEFASPEQFGFSKTDSRSDIYTIGKLMMYLLTGETERSAYEEHSTDKKIGKIINCCTMLSPEKRYRSVEQLSKAIGRILYPPTRRELLVGAFALLLVIAVGLFVWTKWNSQAEEELPYTPISAVGIEARDEISLTVQFETLLNGKPFSDCAVSADNHHWFVPASNGKAELDVFAHENCPVRAVSGNQSFVSDTPIVRDGGPYVFKVDFNDLPTAPETIPLSLPFGQKHEIPLDITGADTVTLTGQPEGLTITQSGDNYYLNIDDDFELPGYYTIFMESVNEYGKADTWLQVNLEPDGAVTIIKTAKELDTVRENLAGHYNLSADIDLSGYEEWKPIGTTENPFTGVFDGNQHEITGLYLRGDVGNTQFELGLFGVVDRGIIRNLIIDTPEAGIFNESYGNAGAVAGTLKSGLIEQCAVLNGEMLADIGVDSSLAGVVGLNRGTVRQCFNSCAVTIYAGMQRSKTGSNAGGIVGQNFGYVVDCGNIGNITGVSLAGGITGLTERGTVTRCYDAGSVTAPAYLGTYPPGAISHMLGHGVAISYCAFERGTAPVGSTVFNRGTLLGIVPLDNGDLKNIETLSRVFHVQDAADTWVYADWLPGYPVPKGIWEE